MAGIRPAVAAGMVVARSVSRPPARVLSTLQRVQPVDLTAVADIDSRDCRQLVTQSHQY
ncbi:hypothetical protein AB0C12_38360 [Actinoplanes sp. NPDC048967]|uniref:hypothetical protein n=1 Tax=Actinoplanes sp. NPDC048967 TaxID=3155269 RepID=UPI0033E3439B